MTPNGFAHRLRAASAPAVGALAAVTWVGGAAGADRVHPAVVELFQSQGCSSCPPANANVIALSERPDVLALSFQVTYWDQLGWKDTFASPRYTARQWDYARALGHGEVWTPQVVVNGRADVVGTRKGEIERLIARNDRANSGPVVSVDAGRVTISGAPPARPSEVWLVRYDPKVVQVAIKSGENGGRTLPHKNIVRELVRLGAWSGRPFSVALPPASQVGLKAAILVQAGRGGAIVAAARV
ncbi:MAG TPA: DUF1223 domain-containing protein [Caulobacteraceae bacterium]